MDNRNLNKQNRVTTKPAALFIAEQVEEPKATGEYCTRTDTWSNRNYELAASKKHCEEM